jgi:hypothetical protein
MIAHSIVYLILSVMVAITVYAVATPVHKSTRGQHDLGERERCETLCTERSGA